MARFYATARVMPNRGSFLNRKFSERICLGGRGFSPDTQNGLRGFQALKFQGIKSWVVRTSTSGLNPRPRELQTSEEFGWCYF